MAGVAEVSGKDRSYRALQAIARTLTFGLRKPRSHWRVSGRRVTWSGLHFKGITLPAVLRLGCTRARMETQRPVQRLLQ